MRPIFVSAILLLVLQGTAWLALRRGLPEWWAQRGIRRAFHALVAVGVGTVLFRTIGFATDAFAAQRFGAGLGSVALAFSLPLAIFLPVAALQVRALSLLLLNRGDRDVERVATPAPASIASPASPAAPEPTASIADAAPDPLGGARLAAPPSPEPANAPTSAQLSRRRFIHLSSSALPVAALSTSAGGLVMAQAPQKLPVIPMRYPGLPDDLVGLRILHLSDLHLGYFMHIPELEACLARAAALAPDLIVFTGDVADDLEQLAPAMAAALQIRPRLGAFACIGNHEHFRGITKVRRIYDKGQVPLLYEQGATVSVGKARLHLAGSNDPVSLRGDLRPFLERSVASAMDGAPSDAFHLLLSHRPEGFDPASALGIDLTLSGHTHGAQIGIGGRSAFESMYPDKYLWGAYAKGKSRLYTSAGFGHWFPFRINCPTEAPVLVLERA